MPNNAFPRKAALSRSLEKAAWRAAREAKADGELFWDNAKPKIPLATLKTLILQAFQQGFEWRKHVRPALIYGIKEAHAAACLSHIHNPGAFATAIFREKLASMRPDLDHLAQVIEKRRSAPATAEHAETPRQIPEEEPIATTPLPSPNPPDLRNQAECRAMDRLAAYIEENMEAIAKLSPEESEASLFVKMREFTEEELQRF